MNDVEKTIRAEDAAAQEAGTGAPRVTYDDILSKIILETYFTAAQANMAAGATGQDFCDTSDQFDAAIKSLGLLTICVLVLDNGFTVTGESACASPENFNPEFGRQLARKQAIEKVWMLEGYRLRQRLHDAG